MSTKQPWIELKTLPEYFADVASGAKTFELRRHDRNVTVGSVLRLREWSPTAEAYTGRDRLRRVTYVLQNAPQFGLQDGFAIYALAALTSPEPASGETEFPTNETLAYIGAIGRKGCISKHRATNYKHVKDTIERLDAGGDREASDTLMWHVWFRILDHQREEFLLAYKDEQIAALALAQPEHASVGVVEALSELADLMDAVRSGDYKPDSFTTQPARSVLAALQAKPQSPEIAQVLSDVIWRIDDGQLTAARKKLVELLERLPDNGKD
jgi:hypothetical protein